MWVRRIVRRIGWTSSPLCRTSDRIEAWATTALIVVILSIGPWAAARAATAVYRHDLRMNVYERAHRFRVHGVLMEDAAWHADSIGYGQPTPDSVLVVVSWPRRNGAVETGTAAAPVGQRAGSTVQIWVDDGGSQSAPPAQRSPRADATGVAVLALCVLTGGFVGVRQTFRSMLNRRRLRSWQAEWLAVEPRWSRR
jgi:hypothetical protein